MNASKKLSRNETQSYCTCTANAAGVLPQFFSKNNRRLDAGTALLS
jgi:hypothetical protein